jgi:hypothetical protein
MGSITDRIDNVTRIPPAYQHAKLPAPKSVKIEISPALQLSLRILRAAHARGAA